MPKRTAQARRPPRLTVLLAREAPLGVVLRRGPSKLVRLVIWNRDTDKFKPGSWFKGRIYGERSDVSPDGRHLIYFALAGVAWAVPATGGTWTAISRLPSLKASALWGQGDTWSGGGFFLSNNSFWLESDDKTFLIRDNSGLRRETYGPKLQYRSREERDGWVGARTPGAILEKGIRNGWILRRLGWKGSYELEQPGECKINFPGWEWADWDRNRLVWVEDGCICTAGIGANKLGSIRTLYDFNGMAPPKTRPPAQTRKWEASN